MSFHEYNLKFSQLYLYASEMVVDMRSKMSLFFAGFSHLASKEVNAAMLIGDMHITRLMIHVQQVKQHGPSPSSSSAPAPRNKGEFKNKNSQNFRVRPA
ncbi:hypothetical protein MTR67_002986 [Solanum verrucosum]|uniref:Gag-pol polyprotein n=1 Tax=Solanum verrucosum TaxID=315347 RepID=A0AAF0PRV4_SOLVR|nr:hypothetical protein MTR67_002986 [Solanum verrucosum]